MIWDKDELFKYLEAMYNSGVVPADKLPIHLANTFNLEWYEALPVVWEWWDTLGLPY